MLSHPKEDIDIAFKTIYLHTYSYAGTGTSFKRIYSKAHVPKIRVDYFLKVGDWIIENMDFRDLMARCNKPKVLLYLDLPYLSGGKVYRYNFNINDFLDLKSLLDKHQETYLLNLSMYDRQMIDIFGTPNMVTDHYRPTTKGTYEDGSRWECGYWLDFT